MNVFTNLSRPLRTNSKLRIQLLIFRCRVLKAEMIDSELTFKVPLNNNNNISPDGQLPILETLDRTRLQLINDIEYTLDYNG